MSIIQVKKQLAEAIDIYDRLNSELNNTKTNLQNYSEEQWHTHLSSLGLEAAKLIQSSHNMNNDNLINLIKRKQKKLIRHATWKKRNKKRTRQEMKQRLKRNEKWIKEIEWKVTMSPSSVALELSQKDDKSMEIKEKDKLAAKIKELSKKLSKLTQLRNLRRKRLESKGHFFADEGNQFFNQIKEWNEQQKHEAAPEKKQLIIHQDDVWRDAPIDKEAYSYWCEADQSLEALLKIRRLWDQYILFNSSNDLEDERLYKVPPTFLTPSPPANLIWASYLSSQ
ncbi:uncharacterized protein BX663DRAFT_551182 [Cokeromyces recurvatus]|uniref:uncharacterized protein n=1 Tax=Cokeromyces recurvatus TaxID=90255 RepID=UPI00221F93A2|nr:uncharacterized protein BX663DRAFT_551182 [Cokeromyces recurvatus]KAI7903449.1 hypothetical protein BX663DRAFT_551182 [Cokeromyces recurvatus]